jgi:hypothetical protein
MDIIYVAGVLFASVTAPLVLALVTGRQHRRDKEQDYARQDAVAAQAAEAARLLLESNEKAAEGVSETNQKLDVIHTLVNSNMTAAMESELGALTRELAMMREVIGLKEAAGRKPTPEALKEIERGRDKIAEVQAMLEDRRKQQEIINGQVEQ